MYQIPIELQPFLLLSIASLLGLMLGSFASLVSYRLPLQQEFVLQRSHCTYCQHPLGFFDLFPVFSWLLQKGKCRYCQHRISGRYPLIELFTASGFATISFLYGASLLTLLLWLLFVISVILIIIDWEHYLLPDSLQFLLWLGSFGYIFLTAGSYIESIFTGIFCAALVFTIKAFFRWLRGFEGMGMGDIKLFGVTGSYLSLIHLPWFFWFAGMFGILTSLIWHLLGKGRFFPFGPAILLSWLLCLLIPKTEWLTLTEWLKILLA